MASAAATSLQTAPPPPSVEGSIAAPPSVIASISSEPVLATLDEPVLTTILRDLKRVATKLRHVLVPSGTQTETLKELRQWDLWGPLLLCLSLSIVMSLNAPPGQTSLVFASVFVLVWAGAAVVTVNAQLLGGKLSFFQSVCVLGYCVFPLVIAAVVCYFVSNSIVRTLAVGIGLVWATRASIIFMSELVEADKRTLAVYPVALFYVIISWMVFIQ